MFPSYKGTQSFPVILGMPFFAYFLRFGPCFSFGEKSLKCAHNRKQAHYTSVTDVLKSSETVRYTASDTHPSPPYSSYRKKSDDHLLFTQPSSSSSVEAPPPPQPRGTLHYPCCCPRRGCKQMHETVSVDTEADFHFDLASSAADGGEIISERGKCRR